MSQDPIDCQITNITPPVSAVEEEATTEAGTSWMFTK